MPYRVVNRGAGILGSVVVASGLLLPGPIALAQRPSGTPPLCRPAGALVKVPELPEASGLAASRRVPGRLWAHNDSGEPVLFALDARGALTGRVTVSGAKVGDWEAVAVGPCPSGSCIFVADIGDNNASRQRITIYRVPESDGSTGSTSASEVFHATYPDGSHDAETLLVSPDGRLFVVTKRRNGTGCAVRIPQGTASRRQRPTRTRGSTARGRQGRQRRQNHGAVSPDGQWVVLRTKTALSFYRAPELFAGNWREARRVDLKVLGEPQGEAVAFGAANALYLAGEGGGKSQPGTFARLTCDSE